MGKKQNSSKNGMSFFKKMLWSVLIIIALSIGMMVYKTYQKIFSPNVFLRNKVSDYVFIPTGATFEEVVNLLFQNGFIINRASFEWLAEQKKFPGNIKAGRYKIKSGMSNNELINLLRSGHQTPVNLVFNKLRIKSQLAGKVAKQLEADSTSIMHLINNPVFLTKYDLDTSNVMAVFIPNTYEFFWNTNAEQFFDRMYSEYQRFWTDTRKEKQRKTKLTPIEVVILASIVEEESNKNAEKPTISGVYLNRLKKQIPLQADPTIKFALGNFEIKRVLKKHLEVNSPYNTYKNRGLPPGPICLPSIATIDAVLNFENHKYLYFCAKDDFSGYHVFSNTLQQHNQNAIRYQKALSKLK